MALIYVDDAATEALAADEREATTGRYLTVANEARAAGVLLGGERLAPMRDATTVRVRDAQTLVVDGPYAETREVLGGYLLLECDSIEEALEWAARLPAAERAAVEVRPLYGDHSEA